MELLGNFLFNVGAFGLFVGYIWALCLAFRKSVPFGIGCCLVGLLLLYFLMTSLRHTWRPALLIVCSLAALIGGVNLLKG